MPRLGGRCVCGYRCLRLILGLCGEALPFMLACIDDLLRPERTGLTAPPSEYFLRNVWVTTSDGSPCLI